MEHSVQQTTCPQGQNAVATSSSIQTWQIRESSRSLMILFISSLESSLRFSCVLNFPRGVFVMSITISSLVPERRLARGDCTGRKSVFSEPSCRGWCRLLLIFNCSLSMLQERVYACLRVRKISNKYISPTVEWGWNIVTNFPNVVRVVWSITDFFTVLQLKKVWNSVKERNSETAISSLLSLKITLVVAEPYTTVKLCALYETVETSSYKILKWIEIWLICYLSI
jgi:hypothetical protein